MAKRSKSPVKKGRIAKLVRKRGRKVGAPPGTLLHVGESHSESTTLRLITYDEQSFQDIPLAQVSDLQAQNPPPITSAG